MFVRSAVSTQNYQPIASYNYPILWTAFHSDFNKITGVFLTVRVLNKPFWSLIGAFRHKFDLTVLFYESISGLPAVLSCFTGQVHHFIGTFYTLPAFLHLLSTVFPFLPAILLYHASQQKTPPSR
ncbi:hypothetical protein [Neobacillus muris]|uniref:hypothetical protein n=1 Tax=Neobacillus muris TaxID=2941334 RepID=UPI00203C1613|nr:hypothetical protein [Neobacillus muris]